MKVLDKIKGWFAGGPFNGAQEGSWRGPFSGMGELGNFFQMGSLEDGWQRHLHVGSGAKNVAIVYACVMLYCRAISQCLPKHMVTANNGGSNQSKTSPASRVLRYPNEYEVWSQFIFNLVAGLLFEGEELCLKVKDERFAIKALHRIPRGCWSIHVDPETKEIFYGISSGELYTQPDYLVPAREVVHFRMHTPRHPLIGESPIKAAAMAVGINVSLNQSQLAFFSQMNRPSGVLTTEATLTIDQMKQLRTAFNEQSKLWQQGGTPILGAGLKWTPVNISQADSQLIEQQRLSAVDVARVFGVPMALLSENTGPQAGTESQITHWLSVGLGSVIENLERTLDKAFELPATESIQLDPAPLLRVDFAARIDGIARAVQSGIVTINEARLKEGFKPVENGDSPMLQQQMVPLDLLSELHASAISSKLGSAQEPEPEPEPEPDPDVTRALVVDMFKRKQIS